MHRVICTVNASFKNRILDFLVDTRFQMHIKKHTKILNAFKNISNFKNIEKIMFAIEKKKTLTHGYG